MEKNVDSRYKHGKEMLQHGKWGIPIVEEDNGGTYSKGIDRNRVVMTTITGF